MNDNLIIEKLIFIKRDLIFNRVETMNYSIINKLVIYIINTELKGCRDAKFRVSLQIARGHLARVLFGVSLS